MKYEHYKTLIDEYIEAGRSKENFCATIGFPAYSKIDENILKVIGLVAAAADNDMKSMVKLSDMKLIHFSRKFMIPYRSLQNWIYDAKSARKPPEYLVMMIGYILITEIEELPWKE